MNTSVNASCSRFENIKDLYHLYKYVGKKKHTISNLETKHASIKHIFSWKICKLKLLIQEKTKSIRLCIWNDSYGKMLKSSNMFIQELHWNLVINNVLIHLEIFCEYFSALLVDMSTWTNCLLRSEADQQQLLRTFSKRRYFLLLYIVTGVSVWLHQTTAYGSELVWGFPFPQEFVRIPWKWGVFGPYLNHSFPHKTAMSVLLNAKFHAKNRRIFDEFFPQSCNIPHMVHFRVSCLSKHCSP